jgi:hypothetical protein
MQFDKITITDKGVKLHWSSADEPRATHGHEFESTDAPSELFVQAVEAFRPMIVDLLGVPERFVGQNCEIRSFSLSKDDDSHRGIVITLVKKLPKFKMPMALNLPYLGESTTGKPASGFMPDGMLQKIEELETEAEAYLHGSRIQRELTLEGAAAA